MAKLQVGSSMTQRSKELRKQARAATRNLFAEDDIQTQKLSLNLAQACIALARNEEWLEGEVPPVESWETVRHK
jgi:hypothetical protein